MEAKSCSEIHAPSHKALGSSIPRSLFHRKQVDSPAGHIQILVVKASPSPDRKSLGQMGCGPAWIRLELPFPRLLHLGASRARQRSSQVSLLDLILRLFLSSLGQLPASRVVVSTHSMLTCKCFHSVKICAFSCKILCDGGQSVLNSQEENTESFPLK